jgi:DmsE family decaheme c-type cytochrome
LVESDAAPHEYEELLAIDEPEDEKKRHRSALLLILLLLLLLCCISTAVDVWIERSPEQREFIVRNIECLRCHTELIPDMAKPAVHDPFLKEECTSCHTPHGEEVTERVISGGWTRWEQLTTILEWLPLSVACEVLEGPVARTGAGGGGEVVSETTTEDKGEDSHLVSPLNQLCWTCHGDMGHLNAAAYKHSPFGKGFCTDCHDPHASDVRVLLKQEEDVLCISCHPVGDERARAHQHPPFEGGFCMNCHDPHASDHRGQLVDNQRDLCFVCHPSVAHLSLKPVQHNPYYYDNCTGCHEPHSSETEPLLIKEQPELCYDCHPEIRNDFLRVSHHPVGTIALDCADCHDPHATDYSALLTASGNEVCYECHGTLIRTTYSRSSHVGLQCIRCHTPHGSDYEPILRSRNPDICLQCHVNYDRTDLNKHPATPEYFDIVAHKGLTCSSTCHDPHGTRYLRMLNYTWPADGICLACHPRVGIDF